MRCALAWPRPASTQSIKRVKLGEPSLVDLPAEQRAEFNSQAARLELEQLTRAIKLFNQAALDLRSGWQPQLPLELAFIEGLQQPALPTLSAAAAATRNPAQAAVPAQSAAGTPVADPAQTRPATNPVRSAAAAQETPPVAPHEVTQSLTLEQVLAVWDGVLSRIKTRSIPAEALLKNCHVSGVEHGTVVLSWPTDSLKSRFEGSKHQRILEDMLSSTLEQKVPVRSVVEDPMLQTALKLGAKVTPVNR
jgi:DNA polymerase III gamma/tau subunit